MKKISTAQTFKSEIFKEQKLTIGVDLGDRWSFYCVLDEAGKIILEQKVPTTPEAMRHTFSGIPRSRIALETGTHSPWISRLLTELGHEVIVAHAQNVRLIVKRHKTHFGLAFVAFLARSLRKSGSIQTVFRRLGSSSTFPMSSNPRTV